MFRGLGCRGNRRIRIGTTAFRQAATLSTHMDVGDTKGVVDLIGLALRVGMKNRFLKLVLGDVLQVRHLVKQLTIVALRLHRIVCVLSHGHSPFLTGRRLRLTAFACHPGRDLLHRYSILTLTSAPLNPAKGYSL
jgi:hypothetical protein